MNKSPNVMVYGKSVANQKPQWLLMQFNLVADGDTIDDALDEMRAKSLRARERLEAAKATEIEFDAVVLGKGDEPDPASQAIAATMARQQGQASSPHDLSNSVSVRVRAWWSLAKASGEDALRFNHQLMRALSDIGSAPAVEIPQRPPGFSNDVAEQLEAIRARAMPQRHDNRNPSFFFVARLEKAAYEQALEDAVRNGREQAERVANAMDRSLGELESLSMLNQSWEQESLRQHAHQQVNGKEWPAGDVAQPELITESGRDARFVLSLMMTFKLA